MSTSIYRNKNCRRPKKTGAAKRKRIKAQQRRLVALGVSEADVEKMTMKELRETLKRPAKISKD